MTGFEPWEEFPFNRGMLCPKGVKRYLQGNHPDRLLDPLMRTAEGFRPAKWDEALDFTARRLRELQEKYGKDSVAVYGGASLTTEKSYLMGKFARVAWEPATSTTTAASAWSRPAPPTKARSAWTARRTRGTISPKPKSSW